jgi:DNA-binding transcriptional LysR family regulator
MHFRQLEIYRATMISGSASRAAELLRIANQQFDIGIAADEVDLSGVEHRIFSSFRAVLAVP